MVNLKGKVAIVTGADAGIGYETALLFAECGADIVITDVNESGMTELQKQAEKLGVKCEKYICDISDEVAVHNTVADVLDKFGKIDILVNNAGIYKTGNGPFVDSDRAEWKKKIDINILGTLYFTQEVLENMIKNNSGRIINIGSVAGVYGLHEWSIYSMTKGAIISFTTALAKEMGKYNITVNTVSPGNIHPPHTDNYPDMSYLGRSGTTRECANVIGFLASDEASYVSGQNYLVDGARKKI